MIIFEARVTLFLLIWQRERRSMFQARYTRLTTILMASAIIAFALFLSLLVTTRLLTRTY
jgi:hypothetical protein